MTEDVTIETAEATPEDVKIEDVKKVESDTKDEAQDESQDEESQTEDKAEEEQKPKTVEERLADVESKYEEKTRAAEAMQKKIDRQTAAYNELQRKLQTEREEIQAKLSQNQAQEVKEPSIDDFDTHEEYVNAVADFRAEQRVQAKEQELLLKQQNETMQKMAQERSQIALQQEADYIKENPRYKASKSEFESFVATAGIPQEVEKAIVETAFMGNVPEVIDYFGANNGERMDELEAISKMPPINAAIEIYKVQQKLTSKPKVENKKPLSKPVKAPKGNSSSKSLDKASGSDILKWVNS